MIKLKPQKIELLRICLTEQRPDLLGVINLEEIIDIDENLGGELQDAVCDHFLDYGYDPGLKFDRSFKANRYDCELEDLIDDIGKLYIH